MANGTAQGSVARAGPLLDRPTSVLQIVNEPHPLHVQIKCATVKHKTHRKECINKLELDAATLVIAACQQKKTLIKCLNCLIDADTRPDTSPGLITKILSKKLKKTLMIRQKNIMQMAYWMILEKYYILGIAIAWLGRYIN